MTDRRAPPYARCRSRRGPARIQSRLRHSDGVGETVEPRTHVVWRAERAGERRQLATNGKPEPVELRQNREGMLVGHVVTDEDRPASTKRRKFHQFANASSLVEGGRFHLD